MFWDGGAVLAVGMFVVMMAGMCVFMAADAFFTKKKNNGAPRLTVEAVVAEKRTGVGHCIHGRKRKGLHCMASSLHFVSFQVESGDFLEFQIEEDSEYDGLSEGEQGRLRFRGTEYLGFERKQEGSIK